MEDAKAEAAPAEAAPAEAKAEAAPPRRRPKAEATPPRDRGSSRRTDARRTSCASRGSCSEDGRRTFGGARVGLSSEQMAAAKSRVSSAMGYTDAFGGKEGRRSSAWFDDEDLQQPTARTRVRLLHPLSHVRLAWDVLMLALIFIVAIWTPMRLAWTGRAPQMIEDMRAADVLIDVVFWGDVVLNFFTGYTDAGGRLEMELRAVARHYARTTLVIDVVASLPYDSFFSTLGGAAQIAPDATEAAANATASAAAQTDYVAVSVAVGLLKLLKLLRLLRLPRIARRLDLIVGLQRSTSTIAKFLVGVFVVAHWWSCGWFALGWYAHVAAMPSWVEEKGLLEPDVGVVEQARRAIPAQFSRNSAQFF